MEVDKFIDDKDTNNTPGRTTNNRSTLLSHLKLLTKGYLLVNFGAQALEKYSLYRFAYGVARSFGPLDDNVNIVFCNPGHTLLDYLLKNHRELTSGNAMNHHIKQIMWDVGITGILGLKIGISLDMSANGVYVGYEKLPRVHSIPLGVEDDNNVINVRGELIRVYQSIRDCLVPQSASQDSQSVEEQTEFDQKRAEFDDFITIVGGCNTINDMEQLFSPRTSFFWPPIKKVNAIRGLREFVLAFPNDIHLLKGEGRNGRWTHMEGWRRGKFETDTAFWSVTQLSVKVNYEGFGPKRIIKEINLFIDYLRGVITHHYKPYITGEEKTRLIGSLDLKYPEIMKEVYAAAFNLSAGVAMADCSFEFAIDKY